MSRHSSRNARNRRDAWRNEHERAVGKVIDYLFVVLPRLAFWYTVKFIATALRQLTELIVTNVNRLLAHRQEKDTPAIASDPPVDSATDQLRAEKRHQHGSAMDDWDHEWARLDSGSAKPAESLGLRPEQYQAAESVTARHKQHQPLNGESSNEVVIGELDVEPAEVRRAILTRFHADVVKLHEAKVAQSRTDAHPTPLTEDQLAYWALAFRAAYEDASQLLAGDPRTMWAWADYLKRRLSLPVTSREARQVLEAIPPGEHVEMFAAVAISVGSPQRSNNALPAGARFAARTFDNWILPSSGKRAKTIPASDTEWSYARAGSGRDPVAENRFTLNDGRYLTAYANIADLRMRNGAGRAILRLPHNSSAPVPPQLGTGRRHPPPQSVSPGPLLRDWHTAEDVALWHMSGPLGFFGSHLTGGVSDRGVDVEHPEAVAQVKMQANPVGSPQIRQLRGTRPHLGNHVFYSTSGFTRAAIAEAAETGVALFTLYDGATVRPHGAQSKRLVLDGHQRHGGDDALVAEYVSSVVHRVHKAHINYGSSDASIALREKYGECRADRDRLSRAESYLEGAVDAVKWHPRIGADTHKAVVSHFRNAELKAAFFCQALGLPYPGDEPLSPGRKRPTAADFY